MKRNFTKLPIAVLLVSFILLASVRQSVAQNYCVPVDTTTIISTHGINAVQTTQAYININNTNSGYSDSGYHYYMYDSVIVHQGDSFTLQAAAIDSLVHWAAWIDWNIDGDFDDPGELVYQNNTTSTMTFSSLIMVPTTVDSGVSRLRVMALYSGNATDPCDTNMDGEAEDYAISFVGNSTSIHSLVPTSPALELFPNPATDQITIKVNLNNRLKTINVFNVLGQNVSRFHPKARRQVILSLSGLPVGIYNIQVQTNEGTVNRRLEIVR